MTTHDIQHAAGILRSGGVVIGPTETFYGLFALASDIGAVDRAASIKRRPDDKPLPLIVGNLDQLHILAKGVSPTAKALIEAFWPGPLALVLPASGVSPLCTDPEGLAAVRLTSHPVARDLALAAGGPLTATSANLSGRPPVCQAANLDPEVVEQVDAVLEGQPQPAGGLPSTLVLSLENRVVSVLRPGAVNIAQLRDAGFTVRG